MRSINAVLPAAEPDGDRWNGACQRLHKNAKTQQVEGQCKSGLPHLTKSDKKS